MDEEPGAVASAVEALQGEVERLRLLHSISQEFNSSLDFDELLPKVFDAVLTAVGAQGGSLYITEGEVLRCRLAMGGASQKLVGTTVPIGVGFVGDVARKQRTTLVRDAINDPRFRMEVDRGSGMIATTVLVAPMVADGVTVGAIEVANKVLGDGLFNEADRELIEGLASAAAVALRNAQLHTAEKRARDLALLLEISREITATLDLDRVLQSVVNLAARAIPFDLGAVGLYEKGRVEIRAIAGEEKVGPKDERTLRLAARAAWVVERGAPFSLLDRDAPASGGDAAFVTAFGDDLETDDVRSGFYLPLTDEEGALGVLLFEAAQPDCLTDTQRELAAILANQTSVALRNAQLYRQVPLADTLGLLAEKKRALMKVPRRRRELYAGAALAALALLTLVRWPFKVAGSEPRFRPAMFAEVRALEPGTIERVLVREGQAVARGAALVQLRDAELRTERQARAAELAAAEREAAMAASRGDVAAERLHRERGGALRQQAALVDARLAAMVVRTPVAGVVLTARPEERVGAHLAAGETAVAVGATDTLVLEFGVAQRDIGRVAVGQAVRVRVDALPQRTFAGVVSSLGASAVDGGATAARFPVRAAVPNPDGLLRPGMVAYAKVLTGRISVLGRLVRAPGRVARLLWWRAWT